MTEALQEITFFKAGETVLEEKTDIIFNGVDVTAFCNEADVEQGYVILNFMIGSHNKAYVLPDKPLSMGDWQPITVELSGVVEIVPHGQYTSVQKFIDGEVEGLPFLVRADRQTLAIFGLEFSWEFFKMLALPDKSRIHQLENHDGVVHFHTVDLEACVDQDTGVGYLVVTKYDNGDGEDKYDLETVPKRDGAITTMAAALEALEIVDKVDVDDAQQMREIAHELTQRGAGQVGDILVELVDLARKIAGES